MVTEEQRRRAEANRVAALAKRNQCASGKIWGLFKCRKTLNSSSLVNETPPDKPLNVVPDNCGFSAVLEVCQGDGFLVSVEPVDGSKFPGESKCYQRIEVCLSNVASTSFDGTLPGGRSPVYMIKDYDLVLKCLKKLPGLHLQEIPWRTLAVVRKFSYSTMSGKWVPCMPGHLSDEEVDALLQNLPPKLQVSLLPFQLDGVKYGLRRGGRCLIADEMGLGKTIQAIAIACCFMNEGPILVVCPAILRYSWAEELESWLPFCAPKDIHLVFGHRDNIAYLTWCPKVVVISYTMLHRLRKSILSQNWAMLIVDESHNIRCTKRAVESDETSTILDLATMVKRIILLSGTPSLSRPALLGKDKYEFAKTYCSLEVSQGYQGKKFQDFSKGIRLQELNVLLRETVMVRRLKEHVMLQLPPKRRQVIRVTLKQSDTSFADACRSCGFNTPFDSDPTMHSCACGINVDTDGQFNLAENCSYVKSLCQLSWQEIGIRKLSGFREWISNHSVLVSSGETATCNDLPQKMIIFGHHLKVLDGVQEIACQTGIEFVRIDGTTLPRDRQAAVQSFRSNAEVRIAIVGITAGGVGLDFSSAQHVAFIELPKTASEMLQAEDRAHRRGQLNSVNIYIFCAKDTPDEAHWQQLNRSLCGVSSMVNGKDNAIQNIEVDIVHHFDVHVNPSLSEESRIDAVENMEPVSVVPSTTNICKHDNDLDDMHDSRCHEKNCSSEENKSSTISLHSTENSGTEVVEKNETTEIILNRAESERFEVDHEVNDIKGPESADEISNHDIQNLKPVSMVLFSKCDDDLANADSGSSCDKFLRERHEDPVCPIYDNEHKRNEVAPRNGEDGLHLGDGSLRFEVSHNTGRVHLYACVKGKDSRPRLLFENFRPEDLELQMAFASEKNNGNTANSILSNLLYTNEIFEFIKQWNDLRPIERNKLTGKPLQLPLDIELCYLKESINHGPEGLLKARSTRRTTPIDDISHPLPENSLWKTIVIRCGSINKTKQYTQAWTIMEQPLCKLCQQPCLGSLAKDPEYFEDLFCGMSCFEEYRIRTSQRSLREALFKIERGICTLCKLDCHKLVKCIRPLSLDGRREFIKKTAPNIFKCTNLVNKLIFEPIEGNTWHADHIVPVYKGGGECRLENMRTLCVACHSEVTAAQRVERQLARTKLKEQLKCFVKEQQRRDEFWDTDEDVEDQDLLVKIPGSAYSVEDKEPGDDEAQQGCQPENLAI